MASNEHLLDSDDDASGVSATTLEEHRQSYFSVHGDMPDTPTDLDLWSIEDPEDEAFENETKPQLPQFNSLDYETIWNPNLETDEIRVRKPCFGYTGKTLLRWGLIVISAVLISIIALTVNIAITGPVPTPTHEPDLMPCLIVTATLV